MAKVTKYPTRITADGKIKPVTERQSVDLWRIRQGTLLWAETMPRGACHDRVCKLQAEYEKMSPLDQIDLRGLTVKEQIDAIFSVAKQKGWLEK